MLVSETGMGIGMERWWARCGCRARRHYGILADLDVMVGESHRLSLSPYVALYTDGRSLAGGYCAARKASSAGCCGVDLVLVSPRLDPADSPAVVA